MRFRTFMLLAALPALLAAGDTTSALRNEVSETFWVAPRAARGEPTVDLVIHRADGKVALVERARFGARERTLVRLAPGETLLLQVTDARADDQEASFRIYDAAFRAVGDLALVLHEADGTAQATLAGAFGGAGKADAAPFAVQPDPKAAGTQVIRGHAGACCTIL